MIRQSVLSLQDVPILITTSTGDPTGNTVQVAFTTPGVNPQNTDWQAAAWVPTTGLQPNDYLCQCLVGPGGTIALPVGSYAIWAKITGNPEIPVLTAGLLTIF